MAIPSLMEMDFYSRSGGGPVDQGQEDTSSLLVKVGILPVDDVGRGIGQGHLVSDLAKEALFMGVK